MCQCKDTSYASEIGLLRISCCKSGIHEINILSTEFINCEDNYRMELCDETTVISKLVTSWLESYFKSSENGIKDLPPVCPTIFNNKGYTANVWKKLMTVKFGHTVSYSELASLCGNPKASRAVGTAMKRNPIPIIIPCHRVIKANGKLGHFSAGTNIKQLLLKHENVLIEV